MRILYIVLPLLLAAPPSLAQVGELDPAFDGDGIRVDSFDVLTDGRSVAALPGGGVAVAGASEEDGASTRVGRLLLYGADGGLDDNDLYLEFGCLGGNPTPVSFYAVASRPDGEYAFGGYRALDCVGEYRPFLSYRAPLQGNRFRNETTPFYGGQSIAFGLAFQPDGALVSAGYAGTNYDTETYDAALARHLPDGTLDTSFGTGGEVTFDLAGDYDFLYDVVVQPDGKIVVGGFGTTAGGPRDLLLLRFLPDGALDPAFGSGGVVSLDLDGDDDDIRALALQPDGTIVAALRTVGASGERFGVARFLPDGALDHGFGSAGLVFVDFTGLPALARGVVVQADGKIVVAGSTETGAGGVETQDFAIARLLPDGALDPTFSGDGRTVAAITTGRDDAQDLTITAEGHFVVVGTSRETVGGEEQRKLLLARFLGDTAPVASEPAPGGVGGVTLHAPVPNPAPGAVTLRYELPVAGPVRIAAYDALGREVAVLVDAERPAGTHTTTLDARALASGFYLVRMTAVGFQQTQTVTLLR